MAFAAGCASGCVDAVREGVVSGVGDVAETGTEAVLTFWIAPIATILKVFQGT
jgi:hypothetical protein